MPERSVRFGVADLPRKVRAATWTCWTPSGGKSDVYLSCRELGGALKVSLHESGAWHVAFDSAQFDRLFTDESRPQSRFLGEYPRPSEAGPRVVLAVRIFTPWGGVTVPMSGVTVPMPGVDASIQWLPKPPDGHATEVGIFVGQPGHVCPSWPGAAQGATLVGQFGLDDGGHAWVVSRQAPFNLNAPPMHGSPRYFAGQGREALKGEGLRMIAWGKAEDGSIQVIEARVLLQSGDFG
jgi:hypothetical protein